MKFALLSGAYKNCGDFLIESSTIKILKHVYPESEINVFKRNQVDKKIQEINTADSVIIGGGPVYMRNLDGYLPLDLCINQIQPPISILGGGWYGEGDGNNLVHNYHFTSKTMEFLKHIDASGGIVSARDLFTFEILCSCGLSNVYMTGCPAWYNLSYINDLELKSKDYPSKIVISDPANPFHNNVCIKLIKYIYERYGSSEIIFLFHRGITKKAEPIINVLKKLNIAYRDLSGCPDGFSEYNDCDLHVGFRVHAHIYTLSVRRKSILIEEDGRGAGVDKALGLPAIKAYNDLFHGNGTTGCKIYKRTPVYGNPSLLTQVDAYLKILEATDNLYLRNAFSIQKEYFSKMTDVIKRIGANN